MKKRILTVVAMLAILVMAVSATAFAASAEDAKVAAAKYVPTTATYSSTHDDVYKYEVKFMDKETGAYYEVEVNKVTGNVSEFQMKLYNNRGSNNVKLSEADIRNIVIADFPGANIYKLKLDREDGLNIYEVSFSADGIRKAEYDINPETGLVIEKDIKY